MADSMSVVSQNIALDAYLAQCNNGFLRLYSGTMPANANASLSGNTLLAELTYGATAFGSASGGVATSNALARDENANAGGTPTFARSFKSDGTSCVLQHDAASLTVNPPTITVGQPVEVGTLTIGWQP